MRHLLQLGDVRAAALDLLVAGVRLGVEAVLVRVDAARPSAALRVRRSAAGRGRIGAASRAGRGLVDDAGRETVVVGGWPRVVAAGLRSARERGRAGGLRRIRTWYRTLENLTGGQRVPSMAAGRSRAGDAVAFLERP